MKNSQLLVLNNFGGQIYPNFIGAHGDFSTGIKSLLNDMSIIDRKNLRELFEQLLNDDAPDNKLYACWIESGASIIPRENQIVEFFKEILKLIDESLAL
jgi:hypothetical protein